VINALLARKRGRTKFLEIGALTGTCGHLVDADRKVGVDLEIWDTHYVRRKYHTFYHGSSNAFFAQNKEKFDCIFIDADHSYEQSTRDFENALECLKRGGFIVMHDSNPPTFDHQARLDRTGDVWRTVVALRRLPSLTIYTVDIETGVTVVQVKKNKNPLTLSVPNYDKLKNNRAEALGLISGKEWLRCYGG
jgi:hypothetical protein